MNTIESLRKSGNKVRVTHSRFVQNVLFKSRDIHSDLRNDIQPKGGRVEISITTPDGKQAEGVAECSSRDSFCGRIGNSIALGRALKQINL